MNGITKAIDEITAEIRWTKERLAKLEAIKDGLEDLASDRQTVPLDTAVGSMPATERVNPVDRSSEEPENPPAPQSLPADIEQILRMAGRPLSTTEIAQELARIRGDVDDHHLTSTLTRVVKKQRIKRPEPGKYTILGPEDMTDESAMLKPDSEAYLALSILRDAGKPLTLDELWTSVKARNPRASKHALVASLYHNSKKGRVFALAGIQVFGLRAWDNHHPEHQEMPELTS